MRGFALDGPAPDASAPLQKQRGMLPGHDFASLSPLPRSQAEETLQRTVKETPPRDSDIDYREERGGKAGFVEAQAVDDDLNGGVPGVNPVGWQWLYQNLDRVKGNWVRFHLVNQWLGGPGKKMWNLVPTTNATNQDTDWRNLEELAKQDLWNETPVYYQVQVSYSNASRYPAGFPSRIEGTYERWNGDSWEHGGSADMEISAPEASHGGGSMVLYPHELAKAQWLNGVGIQSEGIAEWLGSNRASFKHITCQDLIDRIDDESYEYASTYWWKDNFVRQAEKMIRSAAGGLRTALVTLEFAEESDTEMTDF